MAFKKATKYQSKLRCAIFGPSGSGKTLTSLLMAHGMGKKIAVIDSENKTADKYAGQVFGKTKLDFDSDSLDMFTTIDYMTKMDEAVEGGYEVVVVDSASHAWKDILEEVERIAKAKYKGNTWSAWSEGNPIQNKFIQAIQKYPAHLIMTMRSKTEWVSEKTQDGKSKPVRVGLAPEQGKGIEYEFDLLIEMDEDNNARIIKDRTGKFQGKILQKPGVEFGKALLDWLSEGEVEPPPPPPDPAQISISVMVEKLRELEPDLYGLMKAEFQEKTREAYAFGKASGWDQDTMFSELKRRAKVREEEYNKKLEVPKKKEAKSAESK